MSPPFAQFLPLVRKSTAATVLLALCWSPLFAAGFVNVDDRVSVSFSPMVAGHTAKDYSTDVVIRNDSLAGILSPLRLVITSIDRKNTSVSNADGSIAGDAYVEIIIPGGLLQPGQSSAAEAIRFERSAGNSTPGSSGNGKTKKEGFPTFEFEYSVLGGSEVLPLAPNSSPNAVNASAGIKSVVFAIGVTSSGPAIGPVWLRSLDAPQTDRVALDDGGAGSGDALAGDDVFSATLEINTNSLNPGQCLSYAGVTIHDNVEVVSSQYQLCATQFPLQIVESDISPGNLIIVEGGGEAVANEILIKFVNGISEAEILKILKSIKGEVIGTVLPVNLYQVRLASALSAAQMSDLIAQLEKRADVADVSVNGLSGFSSEPNEISFAGQHALQLVRADDVWGQSTQPDPWDNSVATGVGVTVVTLDLGVDAGHTDLLGQVATPAPTVSTPVGDGNVDSDGHGTAMAGIIAAATDNATGIAGASPGVQIQSVRVALASPFTDGQLVQGYQNLASAGVTGRIVNASVNSVFTGPTGIAGLCQAINNAINSGTGKLIVNSAGNQNDSGNRWPGRCNDGNFDSLRAAGDAIDNKARFIVVAASACNSGECATDSKETDSNFGHWVDIAAPGSNVNTTELGNSYGSRSGTSPAAALVSSGAAILNGCGASLDNIEANLLISTVADPLILAVPYPSEPGPGGTTIPAGDTPRLNIYAALKSTNTAPSALAIGNSAINELSGPSDTTIAATTVGSLSVTSGDSCDAIGYSIVDGADAGDFIVNGNLLQFDSGVQLDAETKASFNVTLRATDHFGLTAADLPILVSLNDIDEAPSISPQLRAIDENSANGSIVGAPIAASDPDAGAILQFAITGGNTLGAFAINPASGQITVANVAALDFESTTSFGLTVVASDTTDSPILDDSATVTVSINDVDESPVITAQVRAINENSANGSSVGLPIVASDPDGGAILAFAITAGNSGGAFSINNAGQITVANSLALDFETTPVFNLTVEVTDTSDSPPLTASAAVTVNLNDLVEGPLLPDPIIIFEAQVDSPSGLRFYDVDVTNWMAYPTDLFDATSAYGPCGGNPTPSRAWVDTYVDGVRVHGFCALGSTASFNNIWAPGASVDASTNREVYFILIDRQTGLTYTSNTIVIPPAIP